MVSLNGGKLLSYCNYSWILRMLRSVLEFTNRQVLCTSQTSFFLSYLECLSVVINP